MQMENMVFFFPELAMMQYSLVLSKPSIVVAVAVYIACKVKEQVVLGSSCPT
jgi:hypothetical protein